MSGLVLTGAALTALIVQCGGNSPPVDLLTRIVNHESAGHADAVNVNRNGTVDYGLAQINSSNLPWLGETAASILDPCRNIAAEARILRGFSSYATGSPERGFVLRPPGQTVNYVESMADPRFRGPQDAPVPAAAPPPRRVRLVTITTQR
jgi:hypothetical protein